MLYVKKQRIGLGSKKMINRLINELMAYGMREYLVDEDDRVYITNRLLDLFGQIEFGYTLRYV